MIGLGCLNLSDLVEYYYGKFKITLLKYNCPSSIIKPNICSTTKNIIHKGGVYYEQCRGLRYQGQWRVFKYLHTNNKNKSWHYICTVLKFECENILYKV